MREVDNLSAQEIMLRSRGLTQFSAINDDAELGRLGTLKRYELVNSESSETFDRIVELAAQFIGVPSSAISLLTEDKQWFLAQRGIPVKETPREIAFCEHTIAAKSGLLIVEDATSDERFHRNPLVTGPAHVMVFSQPIAVKTYLFGSLGNSHRLLKRVFSVTAFRYRNKV